jgi:hypothetical protein
MPVRGLLLTRWYIIKNKIEKRKRKKKSLVHFAVFPPQEQRSRLIDEFLLPHPDELPGTDIVSDPDGTWHLYEDGQVVVKAGGLRHSVPCYGYVIAEKIKHGR